MSTISIIIVSWNARDHLEACLRSIRESGPRNLAEIIVVDNASSDGSPEWVERCAPEATLVRTGSNVGFARANNVAMRQATGSMFALVNSDARVHRGCLEVLSDHLEHHPDVGMAGPRVTGGDGLLQRSCRRSPGIWNTLCRALALDRALGGRGIFSGYEVSEARHRRLHEAEVLSGCFLLVRRAAVEQVGGMDERFFFYGEDIDWCKRFRSAGWKLAYVPHATATHFGGGSTSRAPLRYSIEILRATLLYWRKHHGPVGKTICRGLLIVHHGVRLLLRAALNRAGLLRSPQERYKLEEDTACLRWLFFGTEVPSP